jgi:DNA-binding NtrC family response regulator
MSASGLSTWWLVEIPTHAGGIPTIAEVEAQHIQLVLNHHAGNMSRAAKALGIDRRTLYRKLKALGVRQ